ncbi:transposase [Candidatus Aerophobetes bacterium]|nr:transposase [Candidatus Aerophobetes bacterium]
MRFFSLSLKKQIEGTYILLTNNPKIPAYDAICTYKNLSEVEDFFRELKDNLRIRLNYHQTDRRIKAHIFISHLALFLCILKRNLKKKNIKFSPSDAIEVAETIGIACLNINGEIHRIVSRGGRDTRKVVFALEIKN